MDSVAGTWRTSGDITADIAVAFGSRGIDELSDEELARDARLEQRRGSADDQDEEGPIS